MPGSGAPTKGALHPAFPTACFPRSRSHLLCPWGDASLPSPPKSGALAAGSQGSAHRHLLPGLPLNQVKGWGAGHGFGKQGLGFPTFDLAV